MNQLLIKKMNQTSKKKKKGFTLVELIIVIAVIAILAAIAIPKFGEIRTNANKKADLATAKNIATVVAAGIADNKIKDTQTAVAPTSLVATKSGDPVVDVTKQVDGVADPKDTTDHTGFTVTVTNGNIVVNYAGTDTTQVYPEPTDTKTKTSAAKTETPTETK